MSVLDRFQNYVRVRKSFEGLFGDFSFVNRRYLGHELRQFTLELLGSMRLIDVLENLCLESR